MADVSPATILVVDDNPATLYSTSRVLRGADFEVLEAATGEEALVRASRPVDLVILDVNLPDIDGFEVCRRLRARPETVRTPVIHLSATFVKDDDKVQGLQIGADGYLTHPVEPPVLIATVKAFLRARQAEDAMRTSEARFRALFERALNGIALLTDELIYLEVNPAMASTLGRERAGIIGKHVNSFLSPDSQSLLPAISEAVKATGVWRGSFPVLRPDHQSLELEWSISKHSEPGTCLVITTDISERKAAEADRERLLTSERLARAEAERANRLKDDFLAAVSHELRTPLNAILGWTRLVRLQNPSADLTKPMDAIERNVRAQANMIADLLDVSRIASGKLRLDLQQFEPQLAVDALIAVFAPSAQAKRLTIHSEVGAGTGTIVWDLARFQQVVSNLVDNAIKFSDTGGTVTLQMSGTSREVIFTIHDDGRGIAAEFLPYVFDRFRQEEGGASRRHGGLGLGLAIVKQLVEAHFGSIVVSSPGEGKGTTFTIRMPRLQLPQHEHPANASLGHQSLAGVRIFLLDDDEDGRNLTARILGEYGATVLTATDVQSARVSLPPFDPHLVISDISMPGEDGYDFIRFLRGPESGCAEVPAIALTAFITDSDRSRLLSVGYQQHLAKPIDALKLVEGAVSLTLTPSKQQP